MTVAAFTLWIKHNLGATPEHRFHATRRWRFDYAWPSIKLALEVEGGTWAGGRHTTGAGYSRDCEKYNEALIIGWRVLRVTTDMIKDGSAADQVGRAMRGSLDQTIKAKRKERA